MKKKLDCISNLFRAARRRHFSTDSSSAGGCANDNEISVYDMGQALALIPTLVSGGKCYIPSTTKSVDGTSSNSSEVRMGIAVAQMDATYFIIEAASRQYPSSEPFVLDTKLYASQSTEPTRQDDFYIRFGVDVTNSGLLSLYMGVRYVRSGSGTYYCNITYSAWD